ncbi:PPE family protein [Mycobacterium sp. M1]|uniref:PPE family protein n=1 Tax=Mycolicibacter acidiphilus TaxID=2835306 RepID=A0ABS5RRS5_9MYCO|nr:PPE family protein [Mycolicibacter acidiphilus]MBS9536228.1 PPE family protein [Mycolicibacter acidiphilus]
MTGFSGLPPEAVSGRLYAGAGSGPLVAAASAWDRLAATLGSAASSYSSVVSGLVDEAWQGPGSAAMAAAAQPYIEWMTALAGQAAQLAGQVRVAAAAFEAAHAGAVPPAVVAANRSELSSLVSGNVLGQNSAAIAVNQAEYSSMWAQDAAVMQTYAAGSAAATKAVTGFSPAPQTTNPAGTANQAAGAVGTAGSAADSSQGFLADILGTNTFTGLNSIGGSFGTLALQSSGPMFLSEMAQFFELPLMTATGKLSVLGPMAAANAMAAGTGAGLASSVTVGEPALALAASHEPVSTSGVSAGAGRAMPLGRLSVPPAWATAAPDIRLAATALPAAGSVALAPAGLGMAGGGIGGVPMVAGMVNTPRAGETRARAVGDEAAAPVVESDREAAADAGGSDAQELESLRDRMGDLAMECKAVARLMREAMR